MLYNKISKCRISGDKNLILVKDCGQSNYKDNVIYDIYSLAHNVSFWGQKLHHFVSFWVQKYC